MENKYILPQDWMKTEIIDKEKLYKSVKELERSLKELQNFQPQQPSLGDLRLVLFEKQVQKDLKEHKVLDKVFAIGMDKNKNTKNNGLKLKDEIEKELVADNLGSVYELNVFKEKCSNIVYMIEEKRSIRQVVENELVVAKKARQIKVCYLLARHNLIQFCRTELDNFFS
jgi:hypothetical protein